MSTKKLDTRLCCLCGKEIALVDIAGMGPETLAWCKECFPLAKNFQRVYIRDKRRMIAKKYGVPIAFCEAEETKMFGNEE